MGTSPSWLRHGFVALLFALMLGGLVGCSSDSTDSATEDRPAETAAAPQVTEPAVTDPPKIQARSVLGGRRTTGGSRSESSSNVSANGPSGTADPPTTDPAPGEASTNEPSTEAPVPPARSLGELLRRSGEAPYLGAPMSIDPDRVAAAGVVLKQGTYLDLYSDVRDPNRVAELVRLFDAAVPQWCARFAVDPAAVEGWRVSGFLIQDADVMRRAGLLPDDLPAFPNGFFRGFEFWFYDQPSDFYRRCLMLHEGTHAFMTHHLGGAGPPWYFEGMAERIAVHRWDGETLELDARLKDRDEAPLWGRVRLVQDAYAEGRGYLPESLFGMDNQEFLKNESYGWAWALCEFCGRHPKLTDSFATLAERLTDRSPDFALPMIEANRDGWNDIREDWQLFVGEIDYGYDIERASVVRRPTDTLSGSKEVEVAADRGWQSSGLILPAGSYEFSASGEYLMRTGDEEWPSGPDGISIDWYRGERVGRMMLAIRGGEDLASVYTPLLQPQPLGTGV
ncbi:MAG TPA: hypothetical protein PLI18_12200, partial [Pirellulaceae bacterium]|nr:hypothetical protein [Pirellulaceae bacterium]